MISFLNVFWIGHNSKVFFENAFLTEIEIVFACFAVYKEIFILITRLCFYL